MEVHDVFKEQMVVKKPTASDRGKRIFALVGAGVITLACVALLPVSGEFWVFPVLIAGCALYALFKYYPMFYTEYEYIFTNGQLDVDKIVGKEKRTRLISLDAHTISEIGRYDAAAFENRGFNVKIFACSSPTEPDTRYLIVNHDTMKDCLVVFNPNEMILDGIRDFLPRTAVVHD